MNDDVAFMHGLLKWFKCDFFKWCNKPDCPTPLCGGKGVQMDSRGGVQASGDLVYCTVLHCISSPP